MREAEQDKKAKRLDQTSLRRSIAMSYIKVDEPEKTTTVTLVTTCGNKLEVFYNRELDLLMVNLIDKCGRGGNEFIRQTLDEESMLAGLDGLSAEV